MSQRSMIYVQVIRTLRFSASAGRLSSKCVPIPFPLLLDALRSPESFFEGCQNGNRSPWNDIVRKDLKFKAQLSLSL